MSASGYVHPRSLAANSEPDYSLDIAEEPASNYVGFVADLCAPYLGSTVLDVGAGFGAITSHVIAGREVTVLDTSPACIAALRTRFETTGNVTVVEGDISSLGDETYESILLTNVLEHIRDDAEFLSALKRHLVLGGRIVIYVPALNGLYTRWDQKVGHYRRYSKKRLSAVATEAGLDVEKLQYANCFAIPAWMFSGRLVNREQRTVRSLGAWDRFAVPAIRAVESRITPPVGLNLLCVLKY